jgi:hypothetical protein
MADGPAFPAGTSAGWTFELALQAVVGALSGADGQAAPTLLSLTGTKWFQNVDQPSSTTEYSYRIWGKYHYGYNLDHASITKWLATIDIINAAIGALEAGESPTLSMRSMVDFNAAATAVLGWLRHTGDDTATWATDIDRDDSGFKGQAASVIQQRLHLDSQWWQLLQDKITDNFGRSMIDALGGAMNALFTFGIRMMRIWHDAHDDLRNLLNNHINTQGDALGRWIDDSGIQAGLPNYLFDNPMVKLTGRLHDRQTNKDYTVEEWVDHVLDSYPLGSMRTSAAADKIDEQINSQLQSFIETRLNVPARPALQALAEAYLDAARHIGAVADPRGELPGANDPGGNNPANLPPPPGGGADDAHLPPPPGGGADDAHLPPPPGGGAQDLHLPPPPGGSAQDAHVPPPPGGDAQDVHLPPPPGGGDDAHLPPPGGTAHLPPPPEGTGNAHLPGTVNTHLPPPGTPNPQDIHLPPFVPNPINTRFAPPPGAGDQKRNSVGLGDHRAFAELPKGAHTPGLTGPGMAGAGSRKTATDLGNLAHTTLPKGSAGGPGGLAGSPSSRKFGADTPAIVPGAAGAPGGTGSGGVPFFPPMAGGGLGGAGDKPKERERQTWLAEDESVWGTGDEAGIAVIGRPDPEQPYGEEPVPPSRPVRRPRRTVPPAPPDTAATTATAGE